MIIITEFLKSYGNLFETQIIFFLVDFKKLTSPIIINQADAARVGSLVEVTVAPQGTDYSREGPGPSWYWPPGSSGRPPDR